MTKLRMLLAALVLSLPAATDAQSTFDPKVAALQLQEAAVLCERDAASLWGISLCGPMMIVDPDSRRIVANAPDAQGALTRDGTAYFGELPRNVGLANTAKSWNGTLWTMLASPLSNDPRSRGVLLMHEAFHRVQPALGLTTTERSQDQLATLDGRLSFRLELRALRQALVSDGAAAQEAFQHALSFRAWRHARFPGAALAEGALEANEGLAEYTGWKVSGLIADPVRLARRIGGGDTSRSFARSFAYLTGPAYGALLDRYSPGWQASAVKLRALPLPSPARSLQRGRDGLRRIGESYDYSAIRADEVRLAAERTKAEAGWRRILIDGPTVEIALSETNYVYDPNSVSPLPAGNVYPKLEAHGPWGSLEAIGGALISRDWKTLTVGARGIDARAGKVSGGEVRLELAPGWSIVGTGRRLRLEQQIAQPRH